MTGSKNIHEEAMDWEASRIHAIEISERRAWKITFSLVFLLLISWITIVLIMPLKETVPYLVRVDSATGVTDIMTTLTDKRMAYEDVMDKYWLVHYVRARESYDWYTLQKDYDTVGLLSSSNVGSQYAHLFEGENALDKQLGKKYAISVHILSVVPNGKGIASVRFAKRMKRVDSKSEVPAENYVATIGYEYQNPSKMKESIRLVNPFGFQVLSYRVDPEHGGGK